MVFNKKIASAGMSHYDHPEIAINAGGLKFNADVMIAPLLELILNEPFNLKTNSSCQDILGDCRAFISFNTPADACKFLKVVAYNLTDFRKWGIYIGNIGTVNDQFMVNINMFFPQKDICQIVENLNLIKSSLILSGIKLRKDAFDESSDEASFEMEMSPNATSVLTRLNSLKDTSQYCNLSDFPYSIDDKIWPNIKRKNREPQLPGQGSARSLKKLRSV